MERVDEAVGRCRIRQTPMRCTPMRHTPARYAPHEMHEIKRPRALLEAWDDDGLSRVFAMHKGSHQI